MMRCCQLLVVLAAGAALAGCPDAHVLTTDAALDATAADAAAPDAPDAPTVDAPVCLDADGDGAAAASCGGTDCDDTDPFDVPGVGACLTPVTREVCTAGERRVEACEGATPACDARTGECAPTACGDGVLHDGESCDDGNTSITDDCEPDCRWPRCLDLTRCPEAAPVCSLEVEWPRCRPAQPGAARGELCSTDEECASGWCDEPRGTCTEGCTSDASCGGGQAWCLPTDVVGWSTPPRCGVGCDVDAECPGGRVCTPYPNDRRGWTPGWCALPVRPGAFGDPCTNDFDCGSSICEEGVSGVYQCSRACNGDAGCMGDLPNCARYDPFTEPRPAGWALPYFHICSGVLPSDF